MSAEPTRQGRRVDAVALIGGAGAVAVAAYLLGDGQNWLPALDFRWVLAILAGLAGVGLLASSMRK